MDEFRQIVQIHSEKYPLMEPSDYGKLAYQNEFGPKHIITDESTVFQSISDEIKSITTDNDNLAFEPIGNGLCRYYLNKNDDADILVSVLTKLFCMTAKNHKGSQKGLDTKLSVLEEMNIPGLKEWLKAYREDGCPPVHHSKAYRDAYNPHYRLLCSEYAVYIPVFLKIQALVDKKAPVIISIDGRCGSGKTRLAELITKVFACNLFHMDDYYLPFSKRDKDWLNNPGGNMDFSRFMSEVLDSVKAGTEVGYRPYNCRKECISETETVYPQKLNIVEGSYSQHPCLSEYYDLKIFLSCSNEKQAFRLQEREGEYYNTFVKQWIPLEEQYFKDYNIIQNAHLVIDTTQN